MPAPMVKTKTPGIYTRGNRYVVRFRDADGVQRQESARTLDEARRLKAGRTTDVERGEYSTQSRVTFRDFATEWVERYQGRGGKGFRDGTRNDYRRDLKRYAFRYPRLANRRLTAITPGDLSGFIAWMCDDEEQGRHLADGTVCRVFAAVQSCLTTAREEGLIRVSPADRVTRPKRDSQDGNDSEHEVKVFTREQLGVVLAYTPVRYRPFLRLLAATGLRWSEGIALRWSDLLDLTGDKPLVWVRRAYVRKQFGQPKSKHGRRKVPLPPDLVDMLLAAREASGWDRDDVDTHDLLVFHSGGGRPMDYSNVRRDALRPAAEEAGVPEAGFHWFRHTFASMHIDRGTNVLRVSRLMGHHSAAFTLDVYGHLMDDDLGEAIDLAAECEQSANTSHTTAPDPAGVGFLAIPV